MSNQLEVKIGAEIKDFQAKFAKSLKIIDKLKAKSKELSKSYDSGKISADKYYSSLATNTARLSKITNASNKYKGSLTKLEGGFNGASKSIGQGSSAMLAFSRTVQDAPFGMMGISNNITNLTEQFGALKKRTGSAGGALKAMLRDLKGFGGITLAISLATSAWLMFGDKLMAATKNANKLVDAQKELVGGMKAEVQTIESLLKVSKDENKSKKERNRALTKAKELTNGYLDSVNLENISSEKSTKLTNKYSEALLRQAKIKGLSSRISELYSERYEKESKKLSENIGIVESLWTLTKNLGDVEKASAEGVTKANENKTKSLEKIDKQINKLVGSYDDLIEKDNELGGIFTKSKDTTTKIKVKPKIVFGEAGDYDNEFKTVSELLLNSRQGLQDLINDKPLDLLPPNSVTLFQANALRLKETMMQFNNEMNSLISGTINNTFSQLGQSIGQAFAQGTNVMQAIGNTLLNSVAGFLGKMGQMMIEYGTLAVTKGKLDLAIAAGGPVAIGAGLAAIAVGVALSALSGAIGSFSSSGGNSGGSNAGSSSSGGGASFSGGSSFSGGGGTVVFEIQGQKLVGVLKNTLDRNRNLAGTLGI